MNHSSNKKRWSDSDILKWANLYIETFDPLFVLEERLGVSHSTIWWSFMHRLPNLDHSLYEDVCIMLEIHKTCKGVRK